MRFIPAWAGNTHLKRLGEYDGSVHPRVGGEHPSDPDRKRSVVGSSPRGRGTLNGLSPESLERRFIPAWAGNTDIAPITTTGVAVHPRVGGEHPCRKGS